MILELLNFTSNITLISFILISLIVLNKKYMNNEKKILCVTKITGVFTIIGFLFGAVLIWFGW